MYTKGSLRVEASVGCFGSEAPSFVEAIVCCGGCVAPLEEAPTKHGCVFSPTEIMSRDKRQRGGRLVWKELPFIRVCQRCW